MERRPAVSGQFYPAEPDELRDDLAVMTTRGADKRKAIGIISPHAGYMYSGGIAGLGFSGITIPSTILILGPNHRGAGAPAALYPDGSWLTPLGAIPINSRLNVLLLQHAPYVQFDTLAHQLEHSLEVQVPFIQYLQPQATISAICFEYGDYAAAVKIGEGIAAALHVYGDDVLIVASSDMTHYESAAAAKRKDNLALAHVLKLDPEGLLQVCRSERITMCGVMPAAVMLVAASALGATRAEVLAYGTSGDVTGDNSQVVGYASVAVW